MGELGPACQPKLDLSDQLRGCNIPLTCVFVVRGVVWFCAIAAKYNGTLEAAHAHIDDDRYNIVKCGAAGKPTLDLSNQLRGCNIAPTNNYRMSGANVLV